MYKLNLARAEEQDTELPTYVGSYEKQENARKQKKYFASLKPLTVRVTTNCGKFFKRWEYRNT